MLIGENDVRQLISNPHAESSADRIEKARVLGNFGVSWKKLRSLRERITMISSSREVS